MLRHSCAALRDAAADGRQAVFSVPDRALPAVQADAEPVFAAVQADPAAVSAAAQALCSAEAGRRLRAQADCLPAGDFENWDMPEAFVRQGADPEASEDFSAR